MFFGIKVLSLVLVLSCVSAQRSQIGYIIHRSSGKLIHPLGGSANPADNTRLVTYIGGLKQTRLQLQIEKDPSQNGYGYIRHVPSGKYIHPLGGSLKPADNTLLVFHRGKHAACLFKLDMDNDYIIQKSSNKIWHPKGGMRNPPNNNLVVLHRDRHDRATFFFSNDFGAKIFNLVFSSPVGHIVHLSSRKLIHPLGGSAQPADNTRLVVYSGGFGQTRLQLQFEEVSDQNGYGYIKHVPSGKYVHPLGGSLQPNNETPLVYYRGKHAACLFIFDKCNDYIIQKSSQKIWHPKGGSSNPGNNVVVVLHSNRHNRAKFYFADNAGAKVFPY